MKKIYTHPEIELVKLSANDILRTSYNFNLNELDPFDNNDIQDWTW